MKKRKDNDTIELDKLDWKFWILFAGILLIGIILAIPKITLLEIVKKEIAPQPFICNCNCRNEEIKPISMPPYNFTFNRSIWEYRNFSGRGILND